jgi:hypothetical protein
MKYPASADGGWPLGTESVREWFRKKFPAESEAKGEKGDILNT